MAETVPAVGVSKTADTPDRSRPGRGPVIDLVASKLVPPFERPGSVHRSSLIKRLSDADTRPIVSVVAPSGYGKTTLVSQWAESNSRSFAWLSVDEQDNEPKVLLRYIAEALDTVEPVPQRVFDALDSPRSSVPGTVVPRLGSAFFSMTSPVVLVLDDVHVLQNPECRAAVSVLADHVPAGSRLVLAGQTEPPDPYRPPACRGQVVGDQCRRYVPDARGGILALAQRRRPAWG